MVYRVSWSPEALDDVKAIAEFIERDSPIFARAVVQKLLDAARNLNTFPNAGRIVPEFGEDTIRERFVYNYRLIYRVRGSTVLVAAVVHGKRMLEPFEGRITTGE